MADLSKCFFQIFIPKDQRDLFHLVWFKDNDIKLGETEIFRFSRHVWGINSSPYIALHAIERLRGNMGFVLSFFENFGHNIFLTKIVSLILHL